MGRTSTSRRTCGRGIHTTRRSPRSSTATGCSTGGTSRTCAACGTSRRPSTWRTSRTSGAAASTRCASSSGWPRSTARKTSSRSSRSLPAEEDEANAERLRAAGVPVTREPLSPRELWRRLARARLVPLRAGKHLCFSWRTLDLAGHGRVHRLRRAAAAAAGRCSSRRASTSPTAGSRAPRTPRPLPSTSTTVSRQRSSGCSAAPTSRESLRRSAAAYFDEHAAPARVGRYVLESLARRSAHCPKITP